ncbi:CRISPR system precrRNA processing endoribonuclease RAMP protein Cas6 [Magnetococcales bacterium HHB-1]
MTMNATQEHDNTYLDPLLDFHILLVLIDFRTEDHPFLIQGLEKDLRGQLGFHLKKQTCRFDDFRVRSCKGCQFISECLYYHLFDGEHNAVKPYTLAIRMADDPRSVFLLPGNQATLEIKLFGPAIPHHQIMVDTTIKALESLPMKSRSHRRKKAQTLQCEKIAIPRPSQVNDSQAPLIWPLSAWVGYPDQPLQINNPNQQGWVILHIETPLHLIVDRQPLKRLQFYHLIHAIIHRLRDLKRQFGHNKNMGRIPDLLMEQAKQIKIEASTLEWRRWRRYSLRQKRVFYLEGLQGEVLFTGAILPFIPLLTAGSLIQVGKNTTGGLGRITIHDLDPETLWWTTKQQQLE